MGADAKSWGRSLFAYLAVASARHTSAVAQNCATRLDAAVLTPEDLRSFFHEAMAKRQPVIISALTDNAQRDWTADQLVQLASNAPIVVQPGQLVAQFGGSPEHGQLQLQEYIKKLQLDDAAEEIAFDGFGHFFRTKEGARMAAQLHVQGADELLDLLNTDPMVFSLSGSGRGVGWHFHEQAWLELLHGKKRWWVASPNETLVFDKTLPVQAWLDAALQGDALSAAPAGVCAFTQSRGEIVFTPESAFHATYNLAPFTLGVGRRASTPVFGSYQWLGVRIQSGEIAALEQGIEHYPNDSTFRLSSMHRFVREGNHTRALEEIERGFAANPLHIEVQLHRVVSLERVGRIGMALQAARSSLRYIEGAPDSGVAAEAIFSRRSAAQAAQKMILRLEERLAAPRVAGHCSLDPCLRLTSCYSRLTSHCILSLFAVG